MGSSYIIGFAIVLSLDFEISAATAIDIKSIAVAAPGFAANAGGIAALANQPHRAAISFAAIVTPHVARFAIEGLNRPSTATTATIVPIPVSISIPIPVSIPVAITDFEIGAAASIHPDSAAVKIPGPAFDAGRAAALADQANAAARVGRAEIATAIIRCAIERLLCKDDGPARSELCDLVESE